MTLPNFLIVGAAKSGTTTLYHCLRQHPDVFMPEWKEPSYFVGDYPRRAHSIEEYENIFDGAEGCEAVGEASTSYLYDQASPRKIRDTLGDVRIIMVLRNPVDMAYSLWGWMAFRYGFEKLSFADAIDMEGDRMGDPDFRNSCVDYHAGFYYYHRGLYHEQVKRYLNTFGKDRVLIHIFEDFVKDVVGASQKTFGFLGVAPDFVPTLKQRNPASAPKSRFFQRLLVNPPPFVHRAYEALPLKARLRVYGAARYFHKLNLRPEDREPLSGDVRASLAARYAGDIARLERLIGMDLSRWRTPS